MLFKEDTVAWLLLVYVHSHRKGLPLTPGDISAFGITILYSPGLLLTAVPDAPLVAAHCHIFAEFIL